MNELTEIPKVLVAGDTYVIQRTFADYSPSDGYTAVLYLRGIQVLKANSTTVNNSFQFTLTSSTTSTLAAGVYEYSVGVVLNGERVTVETGMVTIKADYATAGSRISHIEKTLAAIEAVIEGRITDDVQNISIAGRSIQNIPILELMDLRGIYTKELAVLKGNGKQLTKTVRLQFGGK